MNLKIFLIGPSGVGKSTFFKQLQDQHPEWTFFQDESFQINLNTYNVLDQNNQQLKVLNYLGQRDITPTKGTQVFDDSVLTALLWSRSLLLTRQITFKVYREHVEKVKQYLKKLPKKTIFIVINKPKELIKQNIHDRNRDIEVLENDFKKTYDMYQDLFIEGLDLIFEQMDDLNLTKTEINLTENDSIQTLKSFNKILKDIEKDPKWQAKK